MPKPKPKPKVRWIGVTPKEKRRIKCWSETAQVTRTAPKRQTLQIYHDSEGKELAVKRTAKGLDLYYKKKNKFIFVGNSLLMQEETSSKVPYLHIGWTEVFGWPRPAKRSVFPLVLIEAIRTVVKNPHLKLIAIIPQRRSYRNYYKGFGFVPGSKIGIAANRRDLFLPPERIKEFSQTLKKLGLI